MVQTSTVKFLLFFEFCFLLKFLQNLKIFLGLLPIELFLNIRSNFIDLNTKIKTSHIIVPIIPRCHLISSIVPYHNFNTIEINQLSNSKNNYEVFVEYFQLLNLLDVRPGQIAVGKVQPLQILQPQKDLCHHLCRYFVGNQTEPSQFGAVSTDSQKSIFGHTSRSNKQFLKLLHISTNENSTFMFDKSST